MDYEPKLLKAGFFTLIAALAVVALLVLPGRAGAAALASVDGPPVISSMSRGLTRSATIPVYACDFVIRRGVDDRSQYFVAAGSLR